MTLTVLAAVTVLGGIVGIAAAAALSEWVRLRHPDRWEARTGLSAVDRRPLGQLDERWLQTYQTKAKR